MQPDENFLLNHLHLLDPILCAWAPLKSAVEGEADCSGRHGGAEYSRVSSSAVTWKLTLSPVLKMNCQKISVLHSRIQWPLPLALAAAVSSFSVVIGSLNASHLACALGWN